MENKRNTYSFNADELKLLKFAVVMPECEERTEKLADFIDSRTARENTMFIESIIDLAVTVIENNRDMVELYHITELGAHPHNVAKINLPDMMGALVGYQLADGADQDNVCHGCAYRKGSVANTCLPTTHDASLCLETDETFFCHEDMNDDGTPSRKCRGYLKKKKADAA